MDGFLDYFLHFLSEKGCHETGPPILPQLPGGGAVALGAGNKRRSFILFWGDRGCIHGVHSGTVWWFYMATSVLGGLILFFLKCIVLLCVASFFLPYLLPTILSLYLLTPSLTSLLSHFLYP